MKSKKIAGKKIKESTQKYLDIAEIKEDCVVLKDGTLRAVLLVSSINFSLKSEEEQNAIIAAYISYVLNFWIARKWGRGIVKKFVGEEGMRKVDDLTKDYGIVTLVFLRIFQGSINDFVSFAMGLTNMKFKVYLVVSLLASIPGTILWYYLSLNASTPTQFTIIMLVFTLTLSFVFIAGSIFWKKFFNK